MIRRDAIEHARSEINLAKPEVIKFVVQRIRPLVNVIVKDYADSGEFDELLEAIDASGVAFGSMLALNLRMRVASTVPNYISSSDPVITGVARREWESAPVSTKRKGRVKGKAKR